MLGIKYQRRVVWSFVGFDVVLVGVWLHGRRVRGWDERVRCVSVANTPINAVVLIALCIACIYVSLCAWLGVLGCGWVCCWCSIAFVSLASLSRYFPSCESK